MAVGVADSGGCSVCDLEDRKIQIGFGAGHAGVDGGCDLQSISSSSSSKAGVLQEGCGSEKKSTKNAEEEESCVKGS